MSNIFLSVTWDVDPEIFSIGSLSIRYYGLTWALTFALGMWFFTDFIKREGLPAKLFDSIFWWGTLPTIIGARLGHCLFYDPWHYLSHPLEILKIWEGGLASHGAAAGLLVGLWCFSRRNKMPYLWSLDRIMVPVTIGGAFVRLGNLMNSEIYGVATDLPWGFRFIQNMHEWMAGGAPVYGPPSHPTQIYEAICYIVTFIVLIWLYYGKDLGLKRPGLMFGVGLIGVFLSRFFIEYVKNPQEAFEEGMTLMMGQWLSIPFVVAGVVMVVRALRRPAVKVESAGAGTEEQKRKAAQQKKEAARSNIKSASSPDKK